MHRVHLAPGPRRGRPALFLDRDGTVVDDPGYLSDPDLVRLLPGAARGLARFADAGHALVLVTNQSGVGRGYYDWAAYDRVAARLREVLAAENVRFDAEFACGHAPEEGAACGWRKPAPGMIAEAVRLLDIDLAGSVMVGDRSGDLAAAEAAGVGRAVHVATGWGATERAGRATWGLRLPVAFADSLADIVP